MTFNQPHMDVLKNLINFCEDNNCIINNINQYAGGKEYDISLTWVEPRHDGSKCKKLLINDGWEPVHNLTCVTDPAITRIELDGEKSEVPDEDGEVLIKKGELKVGDEVVFYGGDKDFKGKVGEVKKVYDGGYKTFVFFADTNSTLTTSFTNLRRKVNGA